MRAYGEYQDTALWRSIDAEISELEENQDLELTTARELVIGSLCRRIALDGLVSDTALSPEPPE